MNTDKNDLVAIRKIRRMLKARIGQVRDRGMIAVAGELAAKAWHSLGKTPSPVEAAADEFDAKFGTDTRGIIQPWNLDIPEGLVGQAIQYGTASVEAYTELLAGLNIEHGKYSFIDLGSGKGRALLLASRFPFKKIIGVELSHQLQHVARSNISRFHAEWQRCYDIVSICDNAATFVFPEDNLVLYLFNPFGAETLRAVVANLESSMRAVPRRVHVIYVKPAHKKVLEESGTFSLVRSFHGNVIYVNDTPEPDPL